MRGILLQKSKVASVRIFGETLKHEAIDDSDNLSRATETAGVHWQARAAFNKRSPAIDQFGRARLRLYETRCCVS